MVLDNNYTHDAPQNGYLVRKKIFPTDNPKTGSWKMEDRYFYIVWPLLILITVRL